MTPEGEDDRLTRLLKLSMDKGTLERPCTDDELEKVLVVLRKLALKSLTPPWVRHSDALRHSNMEAVVFRAVIKELIAMGAIEVRVMKDRKPRRFYRFTPRTAESVYGKFAPPQSEVP